MTDETELQQLRKQLLLARARLFRLRIEADVHTLRQAMQWPQVAESTLTALPWRSFVMGLLLKRLSHPHLARLTQVAGGLSLCVRVARALLRVTVTRTGTATTIETTT